MSFDLAWLDLREPADRAARDTALLRRTRDHFASAKSSIIVDLAAGSGATARALRGLPRARWRLIDNDPALLAAAAQRSGSEVETFDADLRDLDTLPLSGAALVTASALLDLTSAGWIATLADRVAALGAGFYAALSYDGRMTWSRADPDDLAMIAAFNRHQLGDKGFGPALGPAGGACLAAAMQSKGYRVWTADSPWRLGPDAATLQCELLAGVAAAAAKGGASDTEAWRQRRVCAAAAGSCIVGHIDVLALPPA